MKLTSLLCLITAFSFAQQKPDLAFTLKEKDLIPEGIAFDAVSKTFFVSSIYKRKIVKITTDKTVSDFVKSSQNDILEVLGMKVDKQGHLWACNNSPEDDTLNRIANIHVYDVKSGKLIKHLKLSDGTKHLFNDLYFLKNGDTYVTDSEAGAVYRIPKDSNTLEEFIKRGSFSYPNGITATADESKLIVSTGSARGIVSVDLATKEIKHIAHSKFLVIGTDGLYRYGHNLIGVQNVLFPEGVIKFSINDNYTTLEKLEFLTSSEPQFDTPTTGVIVGEEFYFIANSQLTQLMGNKGKIKNPEKLQETLIMKIKLN